MLDNSCWLFSTNSPGDRALPTKGVLSQIKAVGPFWESAKQVKHWQLSGGGFWCSSTSTLPPLVAATLLAFTFTVALRPPQSSGEGVEIGPVKRSSCLSFLPRPSCFSWIDATQIFGSLWLISRVLKKMDFDNFCQCSHCPYGRAAFQRSTLHHSGSASVIITLSSFVPSSFFLPQASHKMEPRAS